MKITEKIRKAVLREQGQRGARIGLARHTKKEFTDWGKLGGRPAGLTKKKRKAPKAKPRGKLTAEQIETALQMRRDGKTETEVAAALGVSRSTITRSLR